MVERTITDALAKPMRVRLCRLSLARNLPAHVGLATLKRSADYHHDRAKPDQYFADSGDRDLQ